MALLAAVVDAAVPKGRYERHPVRTDLVHPALALAAAGLVAGCVAAFGPTPRGALAALFSLALVLVTATDLEYRIVPNRVVVPASAVLLAGSTLADPSPQWAAGAFGASLFLLLAALVYPAGMGMGDVKLVFLMGAALGKTVPVAIVVAMAVSLVPSLYLLARHGAAARKMGIPFAPFLALGSVVALFAGEALLEAYLATL